MIVALAVGLARGLRAAWAVAMLTLLYMALTIPTVYAARMLPALLLAVALWLCRDAFVAPARRTYRGLVALLAGFGLLAMAGAGLHAGHGPRSYATFVRVVRAADPDEPG